MLHEIGRKFVGNVIKPASAQRYACTLIQILNINEEVTEGQKQRTRTYMIKVSGLIHNRSKQRDPRIAWFMFQNIY